MICRAFALAALVALSASAVSGADRGGDTLLTVHRLPAARAVAAIRSAVAACGEKGFATSAAVVDADGGVQAVLRGDGAGAQTVQSAISKATTSAVYGLDSGYWVDRQEKGLPISPLLNRFPNLLLARGGLVVRIDGEVVGGLAVGGAPGGDIDEQCARAGLATLLGAVVRE